MKKSFVWWFFGVSAVLLLGAALVGPIMSKVEEPKYTLAERSRNIEIRDYAALIVAETEVIGERREAIGDGFRIIADYIFGNNAASRKVAMTAPVTQQDSGKIAMTAPVTQQGDGKNWRIAFIMPSEYTIDTLPQPNNPAVALKKIPAKRFAVIRFSGAGGQESLDRHTKELEAFLQANALKPLSPPTYAFYNPPWTLPFMRRNEVLIEIALPAD